MGELFELEDNVGGWIWRARGTNREKDFCDLGNEENVAKYQFISFQNLTGNLLIHQIQHNKQVVR